MKTLEQIMRGLPPERRAKVEDKVKGFFEQLTQEQQKAALEYDGPENHGDPEFLNQQLGDTEDANQRRPTYARSR